MVLQTAGNYNFRVASKEMTTLQSFVYIRAVVLEFNHSDRRTDTRKTLNVFTLCTSCKERTTASSRVTEDIFIYRYTRPIRSNSIYRFEI